MSPAPATATMPAGAASGRPRFPAPEVRRLLAALVRDGHPPGPEPAPWPRLEGLPWPTVIDSARRHGLAPLLFAALRNRDRLHMLPPTAANALETAYHATWTANTLALERLAALHAALAAAGVPLMVLKGAALLAAGHAERGTRPLGDLDLLTRPPHARKACALLAAAGYTPQIELRPGLALRCYGEHAFFSQTGPNVQVDLHWQPFSRPSLWRAALSRWFWASTTTVTVSGQPLQVLEPTAQLLHQCVHALIHGPHPQLLWTYDIARLIHRSPIDWEKLLEAARAFALTPGVFAALALTARDWGLPLPPALRARPARMPAQLRWWAATRSTPALRLLADGLYLRRPGAALTLWGAALFPSPTYMAWRYRGAGHTPLWRHYWSRIVGGGQREPTTPGRLYGYHGK